MADLMGKREVPAPNPDWLEKHEVQKALGVGEAVLDALILAGEFPAGVPWGKKEKRWEWSDVVWFFLHRKVLARLVAGESDDEAAGRRKPAAKE
jgi:predicted DNA-binding transcriptional regulator AlpA